MDRRSLIVGAFVAFGVTPAAAAARKVIVTVAVPNYSGVSADELEESLAHDLRKVGVAVVEPSTIAPDDRRGARIGIVQLSRGAVPPYGLLQWMRRQYGANVSLRVLIHFEGTQTAKVVYYCVDLHSNAHLPSGSVKAYGGDMRDAAQKALLMIAQGLRNQNYAP